MPDPQRAQILATGCPEHAIKQAEDAGHSIASIWTLITAGIALMKANPGSTKLILEFIRGLAPGLGLVIDFIEAQFP